MVTPNEASNRVSNLMTSCKSYVNTLRRGMHLKTHTSSARVHIKPNKNENTFLVEKKESVENTKLLLYNFEERY